MCRGLRRLIFFIGSQSGADLDKFCRAGAATIDLVIGDEHTLLDVLIASSPGPWVTGANYDTFVALEQTIIAHPLSDF